MDYFGFFSGLTKAKAELDKNEIPKPPTRERLFRCKDHGHTFPIPAVAKCPYCNSRYLEAIEMCAPWYYRRIETGWEIIDENRAIVATIHDPSHVRQDDAVRIANSKV